MEKCPKTVYTDAETVTLSLLSVPVAPPLEVDGRGLVGGPLLPHPRGRRRRLAPEAVARVSLVPNLSRVAEVVLHPYRDFEVPSDSSFTCPTI